MGITGLIPFLEKSSRAANVKEYSGCTVAIDAYCWLHRGAFACADRLVMKEPTTMYVSYCMKYVNMLLSHNIKPILVFDGQNLPAKLQTEIKRRENRDINRRKGQELLRAGRVSEGRSFLRRALDVTHEMALEVMKECRRRNVDCIVAPYEADAQLAYLNIQDIAQLVITEDSDLLLFGCKAVLFKMDHNGNGLLIEKERIPKSMGIRNEGFSFDKFRLMCILSGCDYIDSLPGVGLSKACKFVNRTSQTDISLALTKLSANLNMKTLTVTEEYRKGVVAADLTFRCQLVFDPLQRLQVPMSEPGEGEAAVGEMKDAATAYQLALGNLHPKDLRKVDDYDPDARPLKPLSRMELSIRASHQSIWSGNYTRTVKQKQEIPTIFRVSTLGKTAQVDVCLPAMKRATAYEADPFRDDEDIISMYRSRKRHQSASLSNKTEESLLTSRYFTNANTMEQNTNESDKASSSSLFSGLFNVVEAPSTFTSTLEAADSPTATSVSSEFLQPANKASTLPSPDLFKHYENDCATDSGYSYGSDEGKGDIDSDSAFESLPSSREDKTGQGDSDTFEIDSHRKSPLQNDRVEDISTPAVPEKGLKLFKFKSVTTPPTVVKHFTEENSSKNSFDTVGTKESIYFRPLNFSCPVRKPLQTQNCTRRRNFERMTKHARYE